MRIFGLDINIGKPAEVSRLQNLDVKQKDASKISERIIERQLTRSSADVKDWRDSIDRAESVHFPSRVELIRIFQDVELDAHLSSLIQSRTLALLSKPFKLENPDGTENEDATNLLKSAWFNQYVKLQHEAKYYGYSLIQFGAIENDKFKEVKLVPRENVEPNNAKFYPDRFNTSTNGIDFLNNPKFKDWLIWVNTGELGILNKATPLYIWKKNALGAWSEYSEIFGHPLRIGKTNINNPTSKNNMYDMLDNMSRASFGVFGKDDIIEFVTASGSTGENIYKSLIEKANSEISKLVYGQTMTSDDGSSRSQAEVHQGTADTITASDCRDTENNINDFLLPFMASKGFKVEGLRYKYIIEEGLDIDTKLKADTMLLNGGYKLDPDYILNTYGSTLLVEEETEGGPATASELPEIFGYHIDNGVVTTNEVRERLGLAPITDPGEATRKELRAKLQTMKEARTAGIPVKRAAELAGIDTTGLSDEDLVNLQNNLELTGVEDDVKKKSLANSGLYTERINQDLEELTNLYKPFNKNTSFYDIITDEERLTSFQNILSEEDIDKLLNQIYTGAISITNLPINLYTVIAEKLFNGVKKGFGASFNELDITAPDFDLLEDFRVNTYLFSGAKTFQEVKTIQSFIVNKEGFVRPFNEFKEDALQVYGQYNTAWLEAEFNTAIARSRSGRDWLEAKAGEEATPFLKYFTIGDDLVRKDHVELDGVIQPVNSKYWNKYYPPNGWNCRCKVQRLPASRVDQATEITEANSPELPVLFNNNPGKTRLIYNGKHPYFTQVPNNFKGRAKNNFGLPIPENEAKAKLDIKKKGGKNGKE